MQYQAKIVQDEAGHWLVEFPDCPGCQTFGDSEEEAMAMAADALEGWLEVHLDHGEAPPQPRYAGGVAIDVAPGLATSLELRWARAARSLTQEQFAKRAGVSQQQVAKLERPGANPTVNTLKRFATALGGRVEVRFVLDSGELPRTRPPRPKPSISTLGKKATPKSRKRKVVDPQPV